MLPTQPQLYSLDTKDSGAAPSSTKLVNVELYLEPTARVSSNNSPEHCSATL